MMKQKLSVRLNVVLFGIVVFLLALQLNEDPGSNVGVVVTAQPMSAAGAQMATGQGTCSATVHVRMLNQRAGPTLDAALVGSASAGEVFTVLEVSPNGDWLRVQTASGSGWMYAPYMNVSGECSAFTIMTGRRRAFPPAVQSTPLPTNNALERALPAATPAPNLVTPSLSPVFTAEVQHWAAQITAWSVAFDINPNLIATVIQIESCGDATVSSSAGAQGLFQVMPFHFAAGENMLDVETNARRGLDYLVGALEIARSDVRLALAGYNGGHGVIYGNWAAETQRYASWGSRIYADATSGSTVSAALQEWLSAGGSSLCARASQSQAGRAFAS